MAEIKYALEDNVKQNFIEPLHHLQSKDLKEVNVSHILIRSALLPRYLMISHVTVSDLTRTRVCGTFSSGVTLKSRIPRPISADANNSNRLKPMLLYEKQETIGFLCLCISVVKIWQIDFLSSELVYYLTRL